MSLHNKILTYVIEHLGLPLMCAVGAAQKKSSGPEQDAEVMAKMLTSSVDLGLAISSKMNIPSDASKAEALRFRLTALAANALSDRVQLKSKEPAEADIDSLKATADSLFVFSEHFSLDEAGVAYLEQEGLKDYLSKELSELVMVEALLPVVAVIDHKDRGIFPNIAERLIKEAEDLSEKFRTEGGAPGELSVFVKQKILQLLSDTFVRIYPQIIAEKKPIGDVWQEFDRQKTLIVLLMDYLLTGQKTIEVAEQEEGSQSGGGVSTQAPISPEEVAPVEQAPQAPPMPPQGPPAEAVAAPAVETQQVAAENVQEQPVAEEKKEEKTDGNANPLSFFKK